MKKILMMLSPLILAMQLPLSPVNYLPAEWIRTYEFGIKWIRILGNVYSTSAETSEINKDRKTVAGHYAATAIAAANLPAVTFGSSPVDLVEALDPQIDFAYHEEITVVAPAKIALLPVKYTNNPVKYENNIECELEILQEEKLQEVLRGKLQKLEMLEKFQIRPEALRQIRRIKIHLPRSV